MHDIDFILDRTIRPLTHGALVEFFIKLVIFCTLVFLFRRIPHSRPYRSVGTFALIYLGFRILVFSNPLFLTASYYLLSPKNIGYRNKDALRIYASRNWKLDSADFLAVGSSQTGALYGALAEKDSNLATFSVAGMGSMDFNLFIEDILQRKPKTVILSMSEFDLGRPPNIASAKTCSPQELRNIIELILIARPFGFYTLSEIGDVILSQIFTEYRLQFIFRGYRKKLTFNDFVRKDYDSPVQEQLRIKRLTELTPEWFGINELFLRRFLTELGKNNVDVAIVEGHYHPDAFSRNQELHQQAVTRLQNICDSFGHVQYIPLPDASGIHESDYRDAYHIRRESGERIATAIIKAIDPQ